MICFPDDYNSSRRYQAFKMGSGETIGPWTDDCVGKNTVHYEKITSRYMKIVKTLKNIYGVYLGSIKREENCNICACYCDDIYNPKTIRKFSLQEVLAKHDQGVITGIKFDLEQDAIVLKIRVGILDNWVINKNNQSWNSDYVVTVNPGNVPHGFINENSSNPEHPYETSKLQFYWRNINLDNLVAPPGKVIQGVKFVTCTDGISISILATNISEDGFILRETSELELKIPDNPDIPTNGKSVNRVDYMANSYIKFQVSDWIADGSQTTVPFIDTREVITDPPVPLSGIGFYYKTQEKSGGFVALQIQTFDYSDIINYHFINKSIDKLIDEINT
ncbi:uncharacterized protein LOC122856166 [Aphidius gifuensis]|nr:uncharacterized protein LOC122856166 [Aphidius gifuensis]